MVEGCVRCVACEAPYPVVAGVAIVPGNAVDYWSRNLQRVLALSSGRISPGAVQLLETMPGSILDAGFRDESWETKLGLRVYAAAAFEGAEESQTTTASTFYDQVAALAIGRTTPTPRVGIDIGSGVGGIVRRLASGLELAYGIDYSFATVRAARTFLGLAPDQRLSSHVRSRSVATSFAQASAPQSPNAEVFVGYGEAPPFLPDSFDVVSCVNLVEIVPNPKDLLLSCVRLAAPGGRVLVATPFYWRPDRSSASEWFGSAANDWADSRPALVQFLENAGLVEVDVRDEVEWILDVTPRYRQLWKVCVVTGTKNPQASGHTRED